MLPPNYPLDGPDPDDPASTEGCGPDKSGAEAESSPIIIDLDGDGVETVAINHGVFFDHDGNRFAESTGWVAPDDGLLVHDRNGDGVIDSGRELFGNNTLLQSGERAANGYQALKELDENQDGVIDHLDSAWQKLQIWQDSNSNGQVDEGELLSLDETGIASIGTDYTNSKYIDNQSNTHKQTGKITWQDGSTGQSADVWFNSNKGNSRYIGEVYIPEALRELPYIRGFGNLADLHIAMSQNSELQKLIEMYVSEPQSSLIQDIIYAWAGVSDMDPKSRGNAIDARQLAVLETATGEGYNNKYNGQNPLANAALLLKKEFSQFAGYIEAQLLAQTQFENEFELIHFELKDDLSGVKINFDDFEAHLASLKNTDMVRYLQLSNVFYGYLEYSPSLNDVRQNLGIPAENTFIGSRVNDVLRGSAGNDVLFGDEGNDSLYGGNGNDVLVGGTGNDYLEGGSGNDTYLFNRGDGSDTIYEIGGNDTLQLGPDITADQVWLARQVTTGLYGTDSLVIGLAGSDDRITIKSFFSSSARQLEQIVFADGTVWSLETIKAKLLEGTEAAQTLRAYEEGSEIHAGGGNDVLYGGSGDDMLSGGTGNDYLEGGSGNDTYLFNCGDGSDTIYEIGGSDTLQLGPDITAEQVWLARQVTTGLYGTDSDSLVIGLAGSDDRITIQNFFSSSARQLEQIVFADGTVWSLETIKAKLLEGTEAAQTLRAYEEGSEIHAGGGNDVLYGGKGADRLYGDEGNDSLYGGSGNDVLSGGAGNDYLEGGYGNDTYLFNRGDGSDTIYEIGGNDTLQLGPDITADQVWLARQVTTGLYGTDSDSLVIGLAGSDDRITIQNFFSSSARQLEQIVFADGTVWSLETIKAKLLEGTEAAQTLRAYEEGSEIHAGRGNDVLYGGKGEDRLYGDEGNDSLYGGSGNDVLSGGAGNDYLEGGYGNDTYLFNRGDGSDTIYEIGGNDTLQLGPDITADQVWLARQVTTGLYGTDSDSLVIGLAGSDDRITIQNFFSSSARQLEQIVFADGTVWSLETIKAKLLEGTEAAQTLRAYEEGSEIHAGGGNDVLYGGKGEDRLYGDEGNDTLRGDNGNDVLEGGAGNDSLYGGNGNDVLAGGTGNDYLEGGLGNDTYLFNRGDGSDTIYEVGGSDTLQLGPDITAEQVWLARQVTTGLYGTDSLVIGLAGSDDRMTIKSFFSSSARQLEQIVFADGTVWSLAEIKAKLLEGTEVAQTLRAYKEGSEIHAGGGNDVLYGGKGEDRLYGDEGNDTLRGDNGNDVLEGGAGNDSLYGGNGNDVLAGGTGNDYLEGYSGNDTYLFNRGDGQDVIYNYDSSSNRQDVLKFGEDVAAEQVRLSRSGDHLVIHFADSTDRVTVNYYFYKQSYRLDKITFADGSNWLFEDIRSHLEEGIPLPVASQEDSVSLLRQAMSTFAGDDDGDVAESGGELMLAAAQTLPVGRAQAFI
ncbi:calcium-binding protein [Jejubacter sp. L23]|uniref:calcium-binding protein n=1 Tax=Jejubacter sp. L23 TaxID=3092086 RepID=UPI003D7128F9